MKLFLVQAPLWGITPPIGIAQLGAYLKGQGHEVHAFDVNLGLYLKAPNRLYAFEAGFSSQWTRPDWVKPYLEANQDFIASEYIEPIKTAGEAVVGFSINSTSLVASQELARLMKAAVPGLKVVFGGQHFSLSAEAAHAALESGAADAVVLGDGEEAMAELLRTWGEGGDPSSCKGLWVMKDGKVFSTGARRQMDLDELPFADFTLFDLSKYENYDSGLILLATSRGCVRSCAFCGYRVSTPGYRSMSAERIHAEILHQRTLRPDARGIFFYDLIINGDMEVLEGLCDRLIADKARLPWEYCHCLVRPEMTEDICRKMKRAGCRNVQIGLESGSQRVLDLMRKGQKVETMEKVVRNFRVAGIEVKANFMFGFPGETEEDAEKTLKFLRRIAGHKPKVYPSYTFTLLEPASPLNKHKEIFAVKAEGPDSDIFWESWDKTNTYPVRFERYRKFCAEAKTLGLEIEYGYTMPIEAFQAHWLARYYEHKKDWKNALEQYDVYLSHDKDNAQMKAARDACAKHLQPA